MTGSHTAAEPRHEFKHPTEPQDTGTGGSSVSDHGSVIQVPLSVCKSSPPEAPTLSLQTSLSALTAAQAAG